jgi:competence protein ComFB
MQPQALRENRTSSPLPIQTTLTGMAIRDAYNLEPLENLTEDLVLEELERQADARAGRRFSEETVLDIAAYALNQLPPKYSATLTGRVFAPAVRDAQLGELVRDAVAGAISRVAAD